MHPGFSAHSIRIEHCRRPRLRASSYATPRRRSRRCTRPRHSATVLNVPSQVVGIVERGPTRSGDRPIDTRHALATRREAARRRAERAVARLPVDAFVEIRAGRPEEELLAFSADLDLLVTGSHRRGAVRSAGCCSAPRPRAASECPLQIVASPAPRPSGAAGTAVGH